MTMPNPLIVPGRRRSIEGKDPSETWQEQQDEKKKQMTYLGSISENGGLVCEDEDEEAEEGWREEAEAVPVLKGVCPNCHKMIGRGLAGHMRKCQLLLDKYKTG